MNLYFQHMGDGHPVIILHGLFGSSDNWVSIGRKLAERFSVYIPDQRNHGESFHSDTWTYESMVSDLHDFITHHGLNRPHIIGHSMGGKVAMGYALKYSTFIEKLVRSSIAFLRM